MPFCGKSHHAFFGSRNQIHPRKGSREFQQRSRPRRSAASGSHDVEQPVEFKNKSSCCNFCFYYYLNCLFTCVLSLHALCVAPGNRCRNYSPSWSPLLCHTSCRRTGWVPPMRKLDVSPDILSVLVICFHSGLPLLIYIYVQLYRSHMQINL